MIFVRKVLEGEAIKIPENRVLVNLSDVSEVCNSLVPLEGIPLGESSVHSESVVSLEELATRIMQLVDKKVEIHRGPSRRCFYSECSRIPDSIHRPLPNRALSDHLAKRIEEIASSKSF